MRWRVSWVAAMLIAAAIVSSAASAQLSGHNFRGDYGLSSGSQPPPGWYVIPIYLRYDTDTVRDRNGNRLTLSPDDPGSVTAEAITVVGMWVSEKKIWGANYAFVISPAVANTRIGIPVLSLIDEGSTELTDTYLQPINLGWHTKRADFTAGVGIFAPTGSFEFGADDNSGLGMWSFELFGGTTVYLDSAKSWNLALTGYWETHTEKEGSDQKVGNLLTLEGGLGKSFAQGAVNVGLAYYAQWKLTRDKLGFDLPADRQIGKHQVFGVGPDVTLPIVVKEKLIALVTARYLVEFDSESTTEGDTFFLGVTFPIGGGSGS